MAILLFPNPENPIICKLLVKSELGFNDSPGRIFVINKANTHYNSDELLKYAIPDEFQFMS